MSKEWMTRMKDEQQVNRGHDEQEEWKEEMESSKTEIIDEKVGRGAAADASQPPHDCNSGPM